MEHQVSHRPPPRVLVFPLPAQGPVNSMLKLAELLALEGLYVTFLNTHFTHNRLLLHTDIQARFETYPGFLFKTISDGLPDDHPRSGDTIMEVIHSINSESKSIFKQLLLSNELGTSEGNPLVSCIIVDGIFGGFTTDIANELHIPIIHFRTFGACCIWVNMNIPNVIEAGELPVRGEEDMDRLIKNVPAMESFLRFRDLPSFCRASDLTDPNLQVFVQQTLHSPRAQAIILNTFEDLEGPILSRIRTLCPNIYSIGPLHMQLKRRLASKESSFQSSNSLFEVDRSCMTWLDAQPPKTVIYISFGSITVMKRNQLIEFWYGLVNSNIRFLWVARLDLVAGDGNHAQIPPELLEKTKDRGFIVGWAPQEEVLAHPAVGGFLTHSGWNSILESIVAAVPMICWPYFADQQVNSRFVSEVWKLGMDMKDVCDRKIIEKMLNDLMVERNEEFSKAANKMGRLARQSVHKGGSSYHNLDRLIEDIRLTSSGRFGRQVDIQINK
ncbi:7-deoxyloganetic acid glucosyl transferase-like [Ziziphus jujuba]|uniref:Glycosyltransferase n=1 Tax=Ziziphus jujuba TaxID=326968 RepID=A0A6P3ZPN1_ZIZJJ|nr:7-deoxyloganetic acid glucosyl transferase-like [Ziziphus jujuba]